MTLAASHHSNYHPTRWRSRRYIFGPQRKLWVRPANVAEPWWVENELTRAFEKEQELQRDRGEKVLCVVPLDLDGYLFEWTDGKATKLKERVAANFKDRRARQFDK